MNTTGGKKGGRTGAVARTAIALLAAVAVMASGARAAAGGGAPLLDEESAQAEVGYLSAREADNWRVLAEEMEINFGREKARSPAEAGEVLSGVASTDAPAVIEQMRRLRRGADQSDPGAATAIMEAQAAILTRLRALVDASARGVETETLAERVQGVIDAQAATREAARRAAAATLGKSPEDLSAGEARALAALRLRQETLAGELAALERTAMETLADRNADAASRQRVAEALAAGRLDRAREAMRGAASEMEQNRIGRALPLQDEALERLETFKSALEDASYSDGASAGDANATAADEALAALDAAMEELGRDAEDLLALDSLISDQRALHAETGRAAGDDGDALSSLAPRQEELRERLLELGARDGEESEDAAGVASQGEQAQAADEEPRPQPGQSQDSSQSQEPAPQSPSADAPEDATQGQSGRDAEASSDLSDAADAMSGAAESLQRADSKQAQAGQQEAMDAMESERRKRVEELARRAEELGREADQAQAGQQQSGGQSDDTQSLPADARRMAAALEAANAAAEMADRERRLARESEAFSPSTPGQAAAAAGRQDDLAGEAQALSGDAGDITGLADAVSDAQGLMGEASQALRSDNPSEAAGRQDAAANRLRDASSAALSAAADAARQRASQRRGRFPATSATGAAPGAGTRLGEAPDSRPWLATLPPDASGDIVQSAAGAFPRGYEEALRRYYEDIAHKESRR